VGTGQLAQAEDGAKVLLCGLVSALREINTKNGNRMGFATIEDVEGSIEVTIFPELFRQSVAHLKSGSPLLVRGKVEGTSTARKLLADEVRPLPAETEERAVVTPLPRACRVAVPPDGAGDPLPALRAICDAHRGTVPLAIRLRVDGTEVDVRSRTLRVRPQFPTRAALYEQLKDGPWIVARFPATPGAASGPTLLLCDLEKVPKKEK
jgi:DNA polymerase III alpha subunit